jgi:type III restriction enzyme
VNEQLYNQICARLSLRAPQKEALRRLADVLDDLELEKGTDLSRALAAVRAKYDTVTDFERAFPSLCFALATGVGKTRLMGAFITYLYETGRSKNFFVLAPNLTIYEKLIKDFTPGTPKYVFKGLQVFANNPPIVVTGDTYQNGKGLRRQGELFDADCIVNIFNISKINSEARAGNKPRMMRLQEVLGESYFEYLARLPDLVLLMDEAHRYRASAGVRAINELKPVLGLELTATPKESAGRDFRNVIYSYGLGDAMADGFVKEPAVATRENFRAADYASEQPGPSGLTRLEEVKLEDGIHHHEHVKVRLDLYARRTGRKLVHPFMLVVAESIEHAKAIKAFVESERFFNGRYAGKVIEVHSGSATGVREEAERRLVALEHDNSTEIVIHVNQLNEGWDVTNLYTIVPLRAFAAAILTEQTLGRGLRLPYGERTGDDAVDRLTVIAHDHFDAIIQKAKEPGSVTMRALDIGSDGSVKPSRADIVTAKPVYETKVEQELTKAGGFGEPERLVMEVTRKVIEEEARSLPGGFQQLSAPEVQSRIEKRVQTILEPAQGALQLERPVDVARVVQAYTSNLVKHAIEIPEIVVLPERRDVTFWFKDFDLEGLNRFNIQPMDGAVIVVDVRTGRRETIQVNMMGAREPRLENYLVRRLIDRDEIDYDTNAELLFKLAGQMVAHLKTYLKDHEVEAVLRAHDVMLADAIYQQMLEHCEETPTSYKPTVTRGFKRLAPQDFGQDRSLPMRHFREAVTPRSDTRKYLFNGFAKCALDTQRFHSDDERRFAVLIDERSPEVKAWLKPGPGVFEITYRQGDKYQPDFLVETTNEMLICEVKAANELQDPIVIAKAEAARTWVQAANTVAKEKGRKPWRYALIAHDAITESATLSGLVNRYG